MDDYFWVFWYIGASAFLLSVIYYTRKKQWKKRIFIGSAAFAVGFTPMWNFHPDGGGIFPMILLIIAPFPLYFTIPFTVIALGIITLISFCIVFVPVWLIRRLMILGEEE